ncbi:bactofilin family protein [Desulfonatronum thioautotrophicum]|uniref:bactofilin family protein n=1 Tax=Desulfonatronum thioautotrophicum TaxID=617001 RepID=UPI0005EAECB8|nr:polymer-forming cytoskeletal protein [Desulfonatronum thioautotrophicum]
MAKDEINAFLGSGTTYEGKLHFHGAVRIDGTFLGKIDSQGTLIVGQDARIDGEVSVGSLMLSGQLQGRVNAAEKIVLHKTARLTGALRTPSLVIEEGALFDGDIAMSEAGTPSPSHPSVPCDDVDSTPVQD